MFSLFNFLKIFCGGLFSCGGPWATAQLPPPKKIRPCPLWGPWDASPPTLDIMGTRCICPPTFAMAVVFFAGHCVKLTVLPQTSLLNVYGRRKHESGRKWVKHGWSNNVLDEKARRRSKRKGIGKHPLHARSPQLFSRGCACVVSAVFCSLNIQLYLAWGGFLSAALIDKINAFLSA